MNLDWNPNIIQQLHPVSSITEQLRRHALIDRQAPNLVKMADDFTLAYNAARSVVKSKAALAFRLDLTAKPAPADLDLTAPMQIGGLPDLAGAINSSAAYVVHQKRAPSLEKLVDSYWPLNQITGQPLKFLCQLDIYDWMVVAHCLTHERWGDPLQGADAPYNWFSAAGGHKLLQYPHRLQVWYDPDFQESMLGANAFILVTDDLAPEQEVFSRAEILEAVRRKNEEANKVEYATGEALPRLQLAPPTLGFDVEYRENGLSYLTDKLHDKLQDAPIFSSRAEIQLFGKASSQQEPRRFISPYPFHPHRLTPFLCRHSQAHDVTYQLYAAFKTYSFRWVECKVDSSCT